MVFEWRCLMDAIGKPKHRIFVIAGILLMMCALPVGAEPSGQAPVVFRGPVATPVADPLCEYSSLFYLGLGMPLSRHAEMPPDRASIEHIDPDDVVLYDTFEEEGLEGWEFSSGAEVISPGRVDEGSVQLANANMHRIIDTEPGQHYKVMAWVRIVQDEGNDWGGFRIEAQTRDWESLAHSGWLLAGTHDGEWFKAALSFTAVTRQSRIQVGYFGGPGRQIVAQVDELIVFRRTGENRPPEVHVALDPVLMSGGTQRYTLVGDDPDGAISRVVWDFGDGTRSFKRSGARRIVIPGRHVATVQVADDDGQVVTYSIPWGMSDSTTPGLTISSLPMDRIAHFDEPLIHLEGTARSDAQRVMVSTDRGWAQAASGAPQWQVDVPLQPGLNRILAQAHYPNNRIVTEERLVRYVPGGDLAISDVRQSADEVERWDMIEIIFVIENSAATHPQFPYDPEPAKGLEMSDGITAEGLFSRDGWQTVYRRPAFLRQRYERRPVDDAEWLYPEGEPVWTLRFSPPDEGEWHYRIEVQEAKGNATSETYSFRVRAPGANNRGPLRVSPTDSRYFEYADGSAFLGTGHGTGYSPERFSYDAADHFDAIGEGNQELLRWWIGGMIWGSAWQPWNSLTLDFDGYLPPTGLTLERAYGDGLVSLRLDAENPVMFQGWGTGHVGLVPGRSYRIRVRWRTEDVRGPAIPGRPYGVTVKFADWPEPGKTGDLPAVISHVRGDSPWHVAEATFVAQTDFLPGPAIILENTPHGAAYIDEIIMHEVLPDGRQGPQLLRHPRFNAHLDFEPRRAEGIDAVLAEGQSRGIYFKLVIGEKNDDLLNRLAPDGLPDRVGGHYAAGEGSPIRALHRAYWRYLFARYGAYRSVHSWELVNEGDPNGLDLFDLAADLARAAAADGNPHMVSTSTWATLATDSWKNPVSEPLSYVDFHASVRYSGWIEPKEELLNDSARFFLEYDREAHAAGFGKPVVWGEQAIDSTQSPDVQEPLLAQDEEGVWLHKIVWARCAPGGSYPLYWYTEHIMEKGLHSIYGAWNRFMAGIPLSNGRYEDAQATATDPQLRVVGQKDIAGGRAHLWIDNSRHTWRAVVDGDDIPVVSGQIGIAMENSNRPYRVIWFDTRSGEPTSEEVVSADEQGVLILRVHALETDTAVKIEPVE